MKIQWSQNNNKSLSNWHYGKTDSRFRIEVGPNTEGGFSWVIFHEDFKNAVYGDTANTGEEGKSKAIDWLKTMTK